MSLMVHFSNPFEDLTTMWCDTRRLTKLHFPSQHQQLNNTATSPPTTIKFLLKRESRRMKTSTTMANHNPRMNRTNPKCRALLGIVGTWSTSYDSCNCLLIALCVLGSVCSCLVCFLSVWCYMVLVLVFGLSALKTFYHVKPWIIKPLFKHVSLSSTFDSSSGIDMLKLKC
jgi:hypothetical protein